MSEQHYKIFHGLKHCYTNVCHYRVGNTFVSLKKRALYSFAANVKRQSTETDSKSTTQSANSMCYFQEQMYSILKHDITFL